MRCEMRRATLLLVAATLAACVRRPTPPPLDTVDTPVPNVALTTQDGRQVRFYDDLVKGRVVVINFMFARCQRYCPRTTANLARVQAALGPHLGRDVFLYSITLDPEHDTPAVLARYARGFGAAPGWTFLTGRPDDIERLRRRLGVTDPDPAIDADRTQHSGMLIYGNDALGRWSSLPALLPADLIAGRVLHVAAAR